MSRPSVSTRDKQKLWEHKLREQGYSDGYARRPARYTLRDYQVSYRMGSIARDALEEVKASGDDAA
jgi:hypothetical protein